MKMIDQASRAQLRLERTKRRIAQQGIREQIEQFLALGIHPTEDTYRTEEQQSVRSYNQVRDYLQ